MGMILYHGSYLEIPYPDLSHSREKEERPDFILACRNGEDRWEYDIVIGGAANDKVFNTIEVYLDQLLTRRRQSSVCDMKTPICKFVSGHRR